MEFLRLLESIRTPAVNALMSAVTVLGDETVFMVLALAVFWCVSKRQGYYILAVGFTGTVFSQWLKLIFRIPRPWVIDPDFTIVESARAAAAGYSFPSGHTQNIVGTMGAIAVSNRQRWVRALCVVFGLLVPFSRMYLGVHTPLDVGVSFLLALFLVAAMYPCFGSEDGFARSIRPLSAALLVFSLAYLAFILFYPFPADIDAENLSAGAKNAYTLAGCILGLMVVRWFDETRLHFDTAAPLPGQLLKLLLGLALLLAVRAGLKPVLSALFNGAPLANLIRYFLMVVFAGCLWPMTFPFFARVGAKHSRV